VRAPSTAALSATLAVIGAVLIVKGLLGDGNAAYVAGVLFLFAGLGRLYLSRR
jgi:hypothetical protein